MYIEKTHKGFKQLTKIKTNFQYLLWKLGTITTITTTLELLWGFTNYHPIYVLPFAFSIFSLAHSQTPEHKKGMLDDNCFLSIEW